MAENKTKENDGDVEAFLNAVESEKKRQDSFELLKLMEEVTGEEAKMWGTSIIGLAAITIRMLVGVKVTRC